MSVKEFSFKSNIKSIQNSLLANNIKDASNLQFIKSEEAIKDIIKSYTNRFNNIGNMLTDISKYVVNSEDIIDVKLFNDFFESIHLDVYSLYSDLNLMNDVLKLNSERNKQYFLTIKKRIIGLWKKLNLTRNYIYDSNPSDESYYESFSTSNNILNTRNVVIDKKNTFLYLDPVKTRTYNESHLIKDIKSTTYPEENKDSDIIYTTNKLNTLEYNYGSGSRDMLYNGLWKEEVILKEIPSMSIDIGLDKNKIYEGLVSIVDIEYNYPIEFNRLDIDLFGDKSTEIDAVLYKSFENDSWKVAKFVNDDPLETEDIVEYSKDQHLKNKAFNIITFYNIYKVKAKHLRLVFNQKNYSILSKENSENQLNNKISNDLSERRYELLNFEGTHLNKPLNDSNVSIYNKIIKIVESTKNIENILDKISDVLFPTVKVREYSFKDRVKYEIGAWSIEPKLDHYSKDVGSFESKKRELNDSPLVSVSLKTDQKVPSSCTCNWYLNADNNIIPISENNKKYRKEPIHVIDMSEDPYFNTWTDGTFISLDFPIDPKQIENISLYINSSNIGNISDRIGFLNSKLLYMYDIRDPYNANYVIRYPLSLYNTVILYGITPNKSNISHNNKKLHRSLISSNKSILKSFINSVKFRNSTYTISSDYNITNILATKDEARRWFGNQFDSAIFLDNLSSYNIQNLGIFSQITNYGNTKLSVSRDSSIKYFNGNTYGYCDLSILGNNISISTTDTSRN